MRIKSYVTSLARWAAEHLSRKWRTRILCPPHMQAFMFNVELPTNSTAAASALQLRLDLDYVRPCSPSLSFDLRMQGGARALKPRALSSGSGS